VASPAAIRGGGGHESLHRCCAAGHHATPGDRREGHENRDGGGDHQCPHCAGTLTGYATTENKTVVAQPVQVVHLLLPACRWLGVEQSRVVVPHEDSGLPPPLDPPTLLNLSCLFTT
jgi:hypothetical protein